MPMVLCVLWVLRNKANFERDNGFEALGLPDD